MKRKGVTGDILSLTGVRRAVIAGGMGVPAPGGIHGRKGGPPNLTQAAEMLQVSKNGAIRSHAVIRDGVPELVNLVWDEGVALNVAVRAVAALSHEEQTEFVRRVRGGFASAASLLPPAPRIREDEGKGPRHNYRHGEPDAATLAKVAHTFRIATEYTLQDLTKLDDSVTYDVAREVWESLADSIHELTRVQKLLRERINR